jgi:hypothetical protein
LPILNILIPVILVIFYQVALKLPGLKSPKAGLITLFVLSFFILAGIVFFGAIAIFLGIIAYIGLGLLNLVIKWY